MATIKEIKNRLDETPIDEMKEFIKEFSEDSRAGVVRIVEQAERQLVDHENELKRIQDMKKYEMKYHSYDYICGVDEAGRGPLAGPVVAAAVILDPKQDILYVNDSKKLSPVKRDQLYDEIMEKALYVGVGIASSHMIDEMNILQATYEAMRIAIQKLGRKPDILLNDAVVIPEIPVEIQQVPIIKGDAKSISIAAASIIAKVTRDRIMEEFDSLYPVYHFKEHKGYGSSKHIEALKEHGPCVIHRKQFIRNFC